ncbi:MAG: phage tail tube protein [Stenotrophomonas sp.]|uniref:phage tail tube protein n=1 Tax=Stenotrophomonas sp. TaxID=69392 RepID=UPI0029A80053|nr:phage tail tube protein [Stenotrophomonas sp.]MDX3932696.1 phage tail tube protein [Stenotrophomonas sp.]
MTEGVVKTQGTHLFFVDPNAAGGPAIVKFACPTGASGLGGASDQIEDTCLDATEDKTYQRGLGTPGQVSIPFNYIPSAASHKGLFALKKSGDVVSWYIGLSDGTAAPTLGPDDQLVPPAETARSGFLFQGYVGDLNIDINGNEIVRGTVTVQRSGPVAVYGKPLA